MFTDRTRSCVSCQVREKDLQAFKDLLTPGLILQATVRTGLKVVASPLAIPNLTWLAICAACFPLLSFASLFAAVLRILEDQPTFDKSDLGKKRRRARTKAKQRRSKHSPHRDDPTAPPTEEAFVQARQRLPAEFWFNLLSVLAEEFQRRHGASLRFRGFRVLAMDGTQLPLDNWPELRKHFGTAKNGNSYQRAQARLLLLQFPFVRLPFRYVLSPLTKGEITLARQLTKHLQPDDLVLLDAGFWSYDLFCEMQQKQAFFALRLAQNAKLKTLRKFNANEKLVRWTPTRRRRGLPVSIDLRVLRYRVPGFRVQHIVTNLLSSERLSYEDWTRLSWQADSDGRLLPGLYHRRWEIETTFYELKIDQGMKHNLRSRTPKSLQYEVAGHIILYFLVRWLIVVAAEKQGLEPLQISFKQALTELLAMREVLLNASPSWAAILLKRLLERIASHKVNSRPGRFFPRRKSSSNHKRAQQKRHQRLQAKKRKKTGQA